MSVSRSSYYDWQAAPKTAREEENKTLTERLKSLFKQSRVTYGSRRLKRKLSEQGFQVSRRRIIRLMKKAGLYCKTRKKFRATTDSSHNKPIADNLLDRQFNVTEPDRCIFWPIMNTDSDLE